MKKLMSKILCLAIVAIFFVLATGSGFVEDFKEGFEEGYEMGSDLMDDYLDEFQRNGIDNLIIENAE